MMPIVLRNNRNSFKYLTFTQCTNFRGNFFPSAFLHIPCQEINPFLAGKQIHYQIGRLFISMQVIYKNKRNNSPVQGSQI